MNARPMRLPVAALLTFSSLGSFAQPGACENLVACFTPSELGAGVVSFTNCTEPGTNTQYVWHFGDGSDGSGASPEHTYATPGTYTVCLVTYWNNCVDEFCLPIVVDGPDPCAEYEACFVTDELQNNGFFFDNCSPAQDNAQFAWTLSDGSTFSTTDLEHHFEEPGTYEVCLTAIWGNCVETTCDVVAIGGGDPCADLEAAFTFVPSGGGFQFSNSTTAGGENTTWSWNFHDGSSSTDPQPFHEFPGPGVYEVCLTATSVYVGPNGAATTCVDTHCANVTVSGGDPCNALVAGFTENASPLGVQFFNTTTGAGGSTVYTWDFGDGAQSNETFPSHIYPGLGTYEACLTVVSTYLLPSGDEITCDDVFCAAVVIGGPCSELEACFVPSQVGPNAVFFNNCTAPSNTVQYEWHFGDGSTGSDPAPTHTYNGPGTYAVCLVAYWNDCVDEFCLTVVVEGGDPCAEFEACFTTAHLQGNTYFFDNCSPAQGDGQFAWTFGDGSEATSVNADHHYVQPSTYEVCLTATWGNCVEHTCAVVVVGVGGSCEGLEAGFTFLPSGGGYQFANTTSGTGNPTTWEWSFGDGTGSAMEQPLHEFPEPGVYEVCLTVTSMFNGPNGAAITCEDMYCAAVTVGGGPCNGLFACFEAIPLENGVYLFDDCSSDPILAQYLWHFGDGTTSTNNSPDHAFQPGTYTVCLTATWGDCVDDTCTTITVEGGELCDDLVACFEVVPFENGAYLFENCSQLLPISIPANYLWDFGDGHASDTAQPDHTFSPGTWTVCLTVTHGNCMDETCATITVIGPGNPCMNMNADFTTFISPNGIQFSNTTSGTGFQTTFLWSFGDGSSSTDPQPLHPYQFPGTYTVCLVATSIYEGQNGGLITCVDDFCMMVTTNGGDECDPDYATEFTWTAQGTAVVFVATANLPTDGYIWHFGDGSDEDFGNVITHLYEPPGPYEVCLHAWYWNEATEDTCWAYRCYLVDPFNTVGIADISVDDITLFPIPAREVLTISGLPSSATLRLFAADGRLVLNERTSSTTHNMQVSGLASGTYVLRIDAGEFAMHRIVAVE